VITDTLLDIVFGFVMLILSPVSNISVNIPTEFLTKFFEIIRMGMYLIPVVQLMPIIVFFVLMMGFRIIVSLIKTIWNLLPVL